jgi:hypothetical protein
MTAPDEDLLGRAMTRDEQELLRLYRQLHALSQRTDLPPSALMNVRQAMVLLWNACNDLCLIAEEPGCD